MAWMSWNYLTASISVIGICCDLGRIYDHMWQIVSPVGCALFFTLGNTRGDLLS